MTNTSSQTLSLKLARSAVSAMSAPDRTALHWSLRTAFSRSCPAAAKPFSVCSCNNAPPADAHLQRFEQIGHTVMLPGTGPRRSPISVTNP